MTQPNWTYASVRGCENTLQADEWVIALDGKVLRGTWTATGQLTLFSAMLHRDGSVLGQVAVPAETNETQVQPLLEPAGCGPDSSFARGAGMQ